MRVKYITAGTAPNVVKTRNADVTGKGTIKSRVSLRKKTSVLNNKTDSSSAEAKGSSLTSKRSATDFIKEKANDKVSSIKASAKAKYDRDMKKINEIGKKAGQDIIQSAKDQFADILTSVLVIPEPVLIITLKKIADHGGTPRYRGYYSVKEIIKRDYLDTVQWMESRFDMSVTSGKDGSVFKTSPLLGATNISIYILNKTRDSKEDPDAKSRYSHEQIKEIIKHCKKNFEASKIIGAMSKCGVKPSSYGQNGSAEYGKGYCFNVYEIDMFLPEKQNGVIWETYPRTREHVVLMKKLLDKGVFGDDVMVHSIIHKRIYHNVIIYNPIQSIITNAVSDVLRETGLDKIIEVCQNPEQLMYLYISYLIKNGYM